MSPFINYYTLSVFKLIKGIVDKLLKILRYLLFSRPDKSCKMAASPPGSRTATLRLKYNPPDCGTRIVKPHASDTHYRVMRNRVRILFSCLYLSLSLSLSVSFFVSLSVSVSVSVSFVVSVSVDASVFFSVSISLSSQQKYYKII